MLWRVAAVVCLLVVAGCLGVQSPGGPAAPTTASTTTSTTASASTSTSADSAVRVEILDENGTTLGTVSAVVADTPSERYTGLSDTESLGPNEGMLFVYESSGEHTYVMRSMSFPIDIVYVGADRRINRIHHAPVEADDGELTPYPGTGKWVLEVPYNWTVRHGVDVGDRVRIRE
ncbi:MAG: DUF192 domain-containing protein [Halobacterium sp.]